MYFEYGDKEVDYLKRKDKKMAEAIEKIGHLHRPVDEDLFSSVIHHIIGQQISTAAQATIWRRMRGYCRDYPYNHLQQRYSLPPKIWNDL